MSSAAVRSTFSLLYLLGAKMQDSSQTMQRRACCMGAVPHQHWAMHAAVMFLFINQQSFDIMGSMSSSM